jgi:hypothetical protein
VRIQQILTSQIQRGIKYPEEKMSARVEIVMNEKLPQEAERGCALRMSSPPKKVVKSEAGGAAFRMHVARATMVTPRSSLLRKSVRVDRGDVGPPSNIERWENCATQDK